MLEEENNNMMPRPSGTSALPWVILAVVLLVFVVAGVLFRDRLFPSQKNGVSVEDSATSGYQAVFLSNGQVYFGKLSGMSASYATLKDIYYLQVTTPPNAVDASQLNQQQAQQQQQLTLVKLGEELHGPVDEMRINRDQILFYEDIKEDGRVVQAIREYQKDPNKANSNATPNTTPNGNLEPAATNTNTNKVPATNSNTNK